MWLREAVGAHANRVESQKYNSSAALAVNRAGDGGS
jgi:hypothetical protein